MVDIAEFYSSEIEHLLVRDEPLLLIPDLILVKEGVACGDKMILSGQIDDGRLKFDFSAESACILCRAACCLCKKLYLDRSIDTIYRELVALENELVKTPGQVLTFLELDAARFSHREECVNAPFRLLLEWITTFEQTTYEYGLKPDTYGNLECDACVSACRINWESKTPQPIDHHRNSGRDGEHLKNWLTLGKIELLPEDISLLQKMCADMTEEDHQLLSDYTINTFVLHHLLHYAPELIDKRWKASAYLIQKNEINRGYFEQIVRYIHHANLNVCFVKGYISQKYYKFPSLRIHSDYDIIATSSTDAFQLTNYLMHEGFAIRPNLFSLKKMYHGEKAVLSGHFHLQRVIDDTYLLELDISFPGFPVNRVELFYPRLQGHSVRLEEQVVVTLLHLFKHSDIYMKDLNDLYYMLGQSELELEQLQKLLREYDLEQFFTLAASFIAKNYPSADARLAYVLKWFHIDGTLLERYPGWPYDKESHRKIKREDLDKRTAHKPDNERSYLYPVVMFRELFAFDRLKGARERGFSVTQLLDTVCRVERSGYVFFLTSIGILIDSYINTEHISRLGFLKEIDDFLQVVGNPARFPIPYATKHFYVRIL